MLWLLPWILTLASKMSCLSQVLRSTLVSITSTLASDTRI